MVAQIFFRTIHTIFLVGIFFCCGITHAADSVVVLQPPDLSMANFLGYNIGHRPCRKGGIRLEAERLPNGKVLVHNYGHGGSGVSLSWGCAEEVVHMIEAQGVVAGTTVAVVGAGVIGLTVAHVLVEHGFMVQLYAEDFTPDVMSNVAVGVFNPDFEERFADAAVYERIKIASRMRIEGYASAGESLFAGIRWVDSYTFDIDPATVTAADHMRHVAFGDGSRSRQAKYRRQVVIDTPIYLAHLLAKLRDNPMVTVVSERFDFGAEITALPAPAIVNCTGMASRWLFNDEALYTIRGTLLYFRAQPGIDYRLASFQRGKGSSEEIDLFTSLACWRDRIIIGGSLEQNNDYFHLDQSVCQMLYANMQQLIFPDREPIPLDCAQLEPAEYSYPGVRGDALEWISEPI